MRKKAFSGIMLTMFLLVSALISNFVIKPIEASGTIYIRANGSVDPPTAPIQRNGELYTFTDDIYDSIVVQRNNIVINGNGYTLQGPGTGGSKGIDLFGRTNVTVHNTQIKNFDYGIQLYYSSNNSISGNNINFNMEINIFLNYSSSNSISGNNITSYVHGILLYSSSNNSISGNNITNNGYGIRLYSSSNNSISENNIANNHAGGGIWFEDSSSYYNSISGNNITKNSYGITLGGSCNNISGNNITANGSWYGIYLGPSFNSISGNTFTNDGLYVDLYSDYYYQNSVENNTVNGKPLVYLEDVANYSVDNAGQVILVRCDSIRVENLNLSRTDTGVQLLKTNNTIISGNNITANSYCGIMLGYSFNNVIYHNNFIDNLGLQHAYSHYSANIWDDGYPSGGNFWSGYIDIDLYHGVGQNEIGSDGIWDHSYVIDGDNPDNYPLVKPFAHDIGISNLTSSRKFIDLGYCMRISVEVFNYGNLTEPLNITIYANGTEIGKTQVTLTQRTPTTVNVTCAFYCFMRGNYTISASVDAVPGETDLSDNNLTDGWLVITKVGDLGGGVPPQFYNWDGEVDGKDLALFLMLYKGYQPPPPPCPL